MLESIFFNADVTFFNTAAISSKSPTVVSFLGTLSVASFPNFTNMSEVGAAAPPDSGGVFVGPISVVQLR